MATVAACALAFLLQSLANKYVCGLSSARGE